MGITHKLKITDPSLVPFAVYLSSTCTRLALHSPRPERAPTCPASPCADLIVFSNGANPRRSFAFWRGLSMNKISTSESSSRLAVTYRPVGDLIPDPRNARTHPKRQIDQIRTSIEGNSCP